MGYLMWLLIVLVVILVIKIVVAIIRKYRQIEKIKELTIRLPGVEYTEIIVSSNSRKGAFSSANTRGHFNYGTYKSSARTKFLVVYKSGQKQVVELQDDTPLFNEYLQLLKK